MLVYWFLRSKPGKAKPSHTLCSCSTKEAELLHFLDVQKGKAQQSLRGSPGQAGLTLHIPLSALYSQFLVFKRQVIILALILPVPYKPVQNTPNAPVHHILPDGSLQLVSVHIKCYVCRMVPQRPNPVCVYKGICIRDLSTEYTSCILVTDLGTSFWSVGVCWFFSPIYCTE